MLLNVVDDFMSRMLLTINQ